MGVLRAVCQRIAMREVTPALLALLCLLGQATGQTFCGVDSRPHPKGICGHMLLRAHRTLCFLLSADYPNIFSRSIHKRSLKNIDDFPLQAYAEMDLQSGHSQDQPTGTSPNTETMRKLFVSLFPRVQTILPDVGNSVLTQGGPGSKGPSGDHLQAKRAGDDLLPHVQKRGMVCDCCYNACQPSTLAQYCP
uniref:Insulin n=1 Tax=Conus bandanus TaxID=72279 RepID=A0A1B3IIW6_CONBN|nr:insulin precursor [Conus bandanus]